MSASRSILIAGGGIAGLSAALSIAKAGFRVQVFEASKKFETIGAGIQISPNAFKVLELLDLSKTIHSVAGTPSGIDIRSAYSGDIINTVPLGGKAREKYGASYLTLHRADLHQVLYSACQNHENITVNMDHPVDVISQHKNGVSIITTHNNEVETVSGRFLVIADGVNSKLRSMIEPDANEIVASHTGYCAWRAMQPVASVPDFLDMDYVHLCLSSKAHAVLYPVSRKNYLNMVFVTPTKAKTNKTTKNSNVENLKEHIFDNRNKFSWNDKFAELLSDKVDWSIYPILEMPKAKVWGKGSMLAIGDAAHAIAPFSGQGAALAIEDAYELAQLLKRNLDDDNLQSQYHQLRIGRINKMRNLVKSNASMYHMGQPFDSIRNTIMKATPSSMLLSRQNWIYNWQPQD